MLRTWFSPLEGSYPSSEAKVQEKRLWHSVQVLSLRAMKTLALKVRAFRKRRLNHKAIPKYKRGPCREREEALEAFRNVVLKDKWVINSHSFPRDLMNLLSEIW